MQTKGEKRKRKKIEMNSGKKGNPHPLRVGRQQGRRFFLMVFLGGGWGFGVYGFGFGVLGLGLGVLGLRFEV